MSVTYQEESWQTLWNDGQELFSHHWKELALDQEEIPMDLDYERYSSLGTMGMLFILTVRWNGSLVGYVVVFLMPHFHYKSSGLMALTDMYYLLPRFRRGPIGIKLFTELEKRLKEKGISRAHIGCKVHQDHQLLFESLGWKFTDKTFSKLLVKGEPCQQQQP
jgi:GNAT superfamily N-acetyltransferase